MKRVYRIGVVIMLLSLAGIAESGTGHGSLGWSVIWLVVGTAMTMMGYIK